MNVVARKYLIYLALVAVSAFNVLAIHHHHGDGAVPIVVELFGDDADGNGNGNDHSCHGGEVHKCGYHQAALHRTVKSVTQSLSLPDLLILDKEWKPVAQCVTEVLWIADSMPILSEWNQACMSLRAPPEYSFSTTDILLITKQFVKNEYKENISNTRVAVNSADGGGLLGLSRRP